MDGRPFVQKERRHSICPRCEVVRGAAIGVTMLQDLRTLQYRCPSCQHQWQHAASLPNNQALFRGFMSDERKG